MRRPGPCLLLSAVVALGVSLSTPAAVTAAVPAGAQATALPVASPAQTAVETAPRPDSRPPRPRTRRPRAVPPFVPTAGDREDLRQAWRTWQAQGLDDYVTVVRESCFCPASWWTRPFVTRVADGKVVSVTRPGRTRQLASRGYPVERMFRLVRSQSQFADGVSVTYSPRGVPLRIQVDPLIFASDDERTFSLRLRAR